MSGQQSDVINRFGRDRTILYSGLAVMLVGAALAQFDYYIGGTIASLASLAILYGVIKVGYDV